MRGHTFAQLLALSWAKINGRWCPAVKEGSVETMPSALVASIPPVRRPLSEKDAVEIWIARWLRIRRKDLVIRFGCDPRRLYEIWEETRFPASRVKAMALFQERHPSLVDRIDFGRHQRISRTIPAHLQPGLFDPS
jgi:hypothetical protein